MRTFKQWEKLETNKKYVYKMFSRTHENDQVAIDNSYKENRT